MMKTEEEDNEAQENGNKENEVDEDDNKETEEVEKYEGPTSNEENVTSKQVEIGFDLAIENGFDVAENDLNNIVASNIHTEVERRSSARVQSSTNKSNLSKMPNKTPEVETMELVDV